MSELRKKLDLAAARARLEGTRGKEYWRSLDELAATPESSGAGISAPVCGLGPR
jgi:hypothetical protein